MSVARPCVRWWLAYRSRLGKGCRPEGASFPAQWGLPEYLINGRIMKRVEVILARADRMMGLDGVLGDARAMELPPNRFTSRLE